MASSASIGSNNEIWSSRRRLGGDCVERIYKKRTASYYRVLDHLPYDILYISALNGSTYTCSTGLLVAFIQPASSHLLNCDNASGWLVGEPLETLLAGDVGLIYTCACVVC
jgi:hypothetical protein